jgi:hypothetical protein
MVHANHAHVRRDQNSFSLGSFLVYVCNWEWKLNWRDVNLVVQLRLTKQWREDPLLVSFDAVVRQH